MHVDHSFSWSTIGLTNEGCVVPMLKSSLQNVYVCHHDNCQDAYRTWLCIWVTLLVSYRSTAREYGVYISQLIRYLRASFQNVLDRGMLLTRKQFQLAKLKSSLRIFYSRHLELINSCGIYDHGHVPFIINDNCQDAYRTWLCIWVTLLVSYKKLELPTLLEHMGSRLVFGGWFRLPFLKRDLCLFALVELHFWGMTYILISLSRDHLNI
jgi:hypothetical protein